MSMKRLFFNYFKHVPDVSTHIIRTSARLARLTAPSAPSAVAHRSSCALQDLVINTTPGVILSLAGTVVLVTLFLCELSAYMTVTSTTNLVVDELVDEVLRVNFNVTLHQASLPSCPLASPQRVPTTYLVRTSSERWRQGMGVRRGHVHDLTTLDLSRPLCHVSHTHSAMSRIGAVRVCIPRRDRYYRHELAQHHKGHSQVEIR